MEAGFIRRWGKLGVSFCHSELVSESINYYANLIYKSLNILIRTKTQLLFLK